MSVSLHSLPKDRKIFRHHLRRTSLDNFHNMNKKDKKDKSLFEHTESFRHTSTSFDKLKMKKEQEIIKMVSEKQIDNIYFNPKCRENFFKNLIDSYFKKSDQEKHEKEQQNILNANYKWQKSQNGFLKQENHSINLKERNTLKEEERKTIFNRKSDDQIINLEKLNKNEVSKNIERKRVSLRYKEQNKTYHYVDRNSERTTLKEEVKSQKDSQIILSHQNDKNNDELFLPKITEHNDDLNEDNDNDDNHYEGKSKNSKFTNTTDTFMRASESLLLLSSKKTTGILRENSAMTIYTVIENNNEPKRIKRFNNKIFIERHHKAISEGVVNNLWQEYRFDELSLETPHISSLRDSLYSAYRHPVYPDEHMIIQPKSLYYKLLANNCQELYLLFRELIFELNKTRKRVINNSINPSNLYLTNNQGGIRIGDWEYSAFRSESEIQGGCYEARTEPILKCENEFLVEPEYLAPEILQSMIDYEKEFDLWKYDNISDVFSLGLTFIEMITLIPLSTNKLTSIKTKPTVKPREGILTTTNKSVAIILQTQKTVTNKAKLILEKELLENQKNEKFFNLLLRMIEPDREKRISFSDLKKEIK